MILILRDTLKKVAFTYFENHKQIGLLETLFKEIYCTYTLSGSKWIGDKVFAKKSKSKIVFPLRGEGERASRKSVKS